MPVRSFPIASLRAGSEDLGRAMLRLRRNDPDPDIPGIKSWLVSGRTEFLGPLPNDGSSRDGSCSHHTRSTRRLAAPGFATRERDPLMVFRTKTSADAHRDLEHIAS
jgi:hypothetical protein